MKKILMICLVSSFLLLMGNAHSAPAWVPPHKIEKFDAVMNSAREYAKILKADPKIVDAKIKDRIKNKNGKVTKGLFLVVKIKRATLESDVIMEIDQSEKISSVAFKDGKLEIEYKSKTSSLGDKIKYGTVGAGVGSILTLLLVLLI